MSRPADEYPLPTPKQYAEAYRALRLRPHHPQAPSNRRVLTAAALAVLSEAARLNAMHWNQYTPKQQAANRAALAEAIYGKEAS